MIDKSPIAINLEDALSWHYVPRSLAGVAERAGFRVRVFNRRWQVWSTDSDLEALREQERGS